MYHYEGSGLPNVWLKNGYERKRTKYGEGVVIHDLDGLHAALADAIVQNSAPMSRFEFRFLRLQLELSQKSLGDLLGKDEQSVARWEKGRSKIDPSAERLLRLVYEHTTSGAKKLRPIVDLLKKLDSAPANTRIVAQESNDAWQAQAKVARG